MPRTKPPAPASGPAPRPEPGDLLRVTDEAGHRRCAPVEAALGQYRWIEGRRFHLLDHRAPGRRDAWLVEGNLLELEEVRRGS